MNNWKLENFGAENKYRMFISDGKDVICRAPDSFCNSSLKKWPERAYMLMAAPDAIAALEKVSALLDWLEQGSPILRKSKHYKRFSAVLDEVNAVILKSEGKGE